MSPLQKEISPNSRGGRPISKSPLKGFERMREAFGTDLAMKERRNHLVDKYFRKLIQKERDLKDRSFTKTLKPETPLNKKLARAKKYNDRAIELFEGVDIAKSLKEKHLIDPDVISTAKFRKLLGLPTKPVPRAPLKRYVVADNLLPSKPSTKLDIKDSIKFARKMGQVGSKDVPTHHKIEGVRPITGYRGRMRVGSTSGAPLTIESYPTPYNPEDDFYDIEELAEDPKVTEKRMKLKDELNKKIRKVETDRINSKKISQKRIQAIRDLREFLKSNKKRYIGKGVDMVAFDVGHATPPRITRNSFLQEVPENAKFGEKLNKIVKRYRSDRMTGGSTLKNAVKRAGVMDILGELGADTQVVETSKGPYIIQEKATFPFKGDDPMIGFYGAKDEIADKSRFYDLGHSDLHQGNIGMTKSGDFVLTDAGHYRPHKEMKRTVIEAGKERAVRKNAMGAIRRYLPMVGPAAFLGSALTSDPVSAATGTEEMGYDRSFEPDTVDYQRRAAAETLVRALKERSKNEKVQKRRTGKILERKFNEMYGE
jgi:hypothetical protein